MSIKKMVVVVATLVATGASTAQNDPQRSLMSRAIENASMSSNASIPHALRDTSMFAITPPDARIFKLHDLVQIVVRETSRAKSKHELETGKDYDIDGRISAWPHLVLSDLLELQLNDGSGEDLPAVRLGLSKEFEGEGDYKREDDFTARVTAEIVDILPNGNLVLEGHTEVQNDEETSSIMVTGVCRQEDVTAANTVLSNQIHNLRVKKMNRGELKKTNEKGIIAKFLDALFAF
ncbi:MAG: flagellar basal body L-ring protein FlgH [Planctomycetes bacterium]|nr:flagellar basal body L-ring protein FlgH [Planctomycetota bacterium]